jgi:Ser/Thr protein kinase RdoA (MazF antagonist)
MLEEDALRRAELPRPDVSTSDAEAILRDRYGLEGRIVELGSQQDRNFRIDTPSGRYVLKICRGEYRTVELEAQNAAMRHLAAIPGLVLVPSVGTDGEGAEILATEINGQHCQVRLLGYLEGEPLTRRRFLPEETVAALGDTCARIARGLEAFRHPGLERFIQWDLRHARRVADHLLATLPDSDRRRRIVAAMEHATTRVLEFEQGLRIQAIHHDITDDNIVARLDADGRPMPVGVIDFGDLMYGWLVADLAVTCASLLHHADGDPFFILPAIRAFHAVHPLTEAELTALWPLVVQRAGVLVASSEVQLAVEPDNSYVLGNIDHERMIFEIATSVPMALMEAAILEVAGLAVEPGLPAGLGRLLPDIAPDRIRLAALDVLSPSLADGNWTETAIAERILAEAARETGVAASHYGEYRLTETAIRAERPMPTYALGVDLHLPAGTMLVADRKSVV